MIYMALRPGRTIHEKERPWTRISFKVPKKSYVAGAPEPKIHMFEMGSEGEYDLVLNLIAKKSANIRSNALEAARIVAHKFLEQKLGKNYFLKVLLFPHHVLREKPIATGAGADRYSQGMRLAFGKPAGRAVQVKANQPVIRLSIRKSNLKIGKQALKRAGSKLPIPTRIEVEE